MKFFIINKVKRIHNLTEKPVKGLKYLDFSCRFLACLSLFTSCQTVYFSSVVSVTS